MGLKPALRVLFPREEIASTVLRLSSELNRDYRGKRPLFIAILKGSFLFLADLVRQLDFPLEIDFITARSYVKGTETSGEIRIAYKPQMAIKDRHVVVIEDIIDTGLTTGYALEYLKNESPASLKLCVLLDKPSRRRVPVKIDYLGYTVPDKFVVGYGLDCDEEYRNLPDICIMEE